MLRNAVVVDFHFDVPTGMAMHQMAMTNTNVTQTMSVVQWLVMIVEEDEEFFAVFPLEEASPVQLLNEFRHRSGLGNRDLLWFGAVRHVNE